MPWVEVQCPNEECPGREVSHPPNCSACGGTRRRPAAEHGGYVDCDVEDDVVPERWQAYWRNTTLSMAGEWAASIHCPRCGEEGEELD